MEFTPVSDQIRQIFRIRHNVQIVEGIYKYIFKILHIVILWTYGIR